MSAEPDALEWTAVGVLGQWLPGRAAAPVRVHVQHAPQQRFRGVYLIVTSPGWFIHEARAGNQPFLSDVDGDAYSRDEHDRLERLGQLERHRVSFFMEVGNMLHFLVSPKCLPSVCGEREAVLAALADSGCPHPRLPFRAVVIGVQR